MIRSSVCAVLALLFVSCGSKPHVGLSDEALSLEPDQAFAAKLEEVAKEVKPPSGRDQAEILAYYNTLVEKSGIPPKEFVLKTISIARGDVGDTGLVGFIQAGVAKVPPAEMLRAVGPYAGTEKHKDMVWDTVMRIVNEHKLRGSKGCAKVLVDYGGDIPRGLMDVFYYLLKPYDAAVMCANVFTENGSDERNSLKQIDGIKSYVDWEVIQLSGDTRAELLKRLPALIESEYWWVRRFAADVVYRYNELQQPELVQPLVKDSEPLVSKSLKKRQEDLRRLR